MLIDILQCCTSADTSNIGKIIYSVGGLGHYPVTDDVNCRSGPGTSFDVQKTYPKGQDVSVTCQAPGTNVNGDTLWDKTTDGCYVADWYVHTGTSNYVTAKCDDSSGSSGGSGGSGGSGSCGAPHSNQATIDLIAGFEGFVSQVC